MSDRARVRRHRSTHRWVAVGQPAEVTLQLFEKLCLIHRAWVRRGGRVQRRVLITRFRDRCARRNANHPPRKSFARAPRMRACRFTAAPLVYDAESLLSQCFAAPAARDLATRRFGHRFLLEQAQPAQRDAVGCVWWREACTRRADPPRKILLFSRALYAGVTLVSPPSGLAK